MSQILKYGWNSTVYVKDKCPAGRLIQEARKTSSSIVENTIIKVWYELWSMIHEATEVFSPMESLHIFETSRRDRQVEYLSYQDSDIYDGKKCLVI